MANNGYLVGNSCNQDVNLKIYLECKATYPLTQRIAVFASNLGTVNGNGCYSENLTQYYGSVSFSFPTDCEIPGPPLTESQQIEAINGLFPAAVAILAIAWGLRYIRVLVAEWLKERNASD